MVKIKSGFTDTMYIFLNIWCGLVLSYGEYGYIIHLWNKKKTPYCWIFFIFIFINTYFLFIIFGCICYVSTTI